MCEVKFDKNWKYTVSRHGRHQISEVGGGNVCMMWNCPDRDRNAHLISAAPEMYEENELQILLLRKIIQLLPVNSQESMQVSDSIDRILEIQAKARGEHV